MKHSIVEKRNDVDDTIHIDRKIDKPEETAQITNFHQMHALQTAQDKTNAMRFH